MSPNLTTRPRSSFAMPTAALRGKASTIGIYGERIAAAALTAAGYRVLSTDRAAPGDLHAINPRTGEVTIIEVKTARRTVNRSNPAGYWQFSLYRARNSGKICTDARRADVTILLAVQDNGVIAAFVIPARALGARKKIAIARLDDGKWQVFRQPLSAMRIPIPEQ